MIENISMSKKFLLDVGIRGKRDYVQGSQILTKSLETLEESLGQKKSIKLTSAKFENTTLSMVWLLFDDDKHHIKDKIGSACFDIDGRMVSVSYFADQSLRAPKICDKPNPVTHYKNVSTFNEAPEGSGVFKSSGSAESILEGTIAFVKRLHQEIATDVEDVWFTSLANAQISNLQKTGEHDVNIEVSHKMRRKLGTRVQTLQTVTLRSILSEQSTIFRVGFSYRRRNEN